MSDRPEFYAAASGSGWVVLEATGAHPVTGLPSGRPVRSYRSTPWLPYVETHVAARADVERLLRGASPGDPCDHCGRRVVPDAAGFYVDPSTESSDCPADDRGHQVEGRDSR